MPVKLPALKHISKDLGDKFVILLPKPKYWLVILIASFYTLFLIPFEISTLFGLIQSIKTSSSDLRPFLIGIVLSSVALAVLIYFLVDQLFGKEEIQITSSSIKISTKFYGFRISKEYSAQNVKSLSLARVGIRDIFPLGVSSFMPGFNVGNISFDYGAKTFKFAGGVEEAEAKQIIAEIQQKFSQYKS